MSNDNLNKKEQQCLQMIADDMIQKRQGKFTGVETIEMNWNDGGLSYAVSSTKKIIISNEKRKVRNGGI